MSEYFITHNEDPTLELSDNEQVLGFIDGARLVDMLSALGPCENPIGKIDRYRNPHKFMWRIKFLKDGSIAYITNFSTHDGFFSYMPTDPRNIVRWAVLSDDEQAFKRVMAVIDDK
jgi:hypothetical protein